MLEYLIYIIVVIVYIIIAVLRHSDMNSVAGLRGFESYDFGDVDLLRDIRNDYNEMLKIYYQHYQPRNYLLNDYCELRLVKNNDNLYLYCKERTDGTNAGNYFIVKGDDNHVSTMWAIFDMEFSDKTFFSDIKSTYMKLNNSYNSVGGLKYYKEPKKNKLPPAIVNKIAQNEYCRMEIQVSDTGEQLLLCSEIWDRATNKPARSFAIYGDKVILYAILAEFTKEKDKMLEYLKLFYKYSSRTDCKVERLSSQKNHHNSILKQEQQPVIKTNIKETPIESLDNKTENKPPEFNPYPLTEKLNIDIEKYKERKVDL